MKTYADMCLYIYLCILANVPTWIGINTNICMHMQTQNTEMYTLVSTGYKRLNYKASQKLSSTQKLPLEISSKTVFKKLMDLPAALSKLQVNNC